MAKKKQEKEIVKVKKISNVIDCKCGKEWDRKKVEGDLTVHTTNSYRFKFLRSFTTLSSGFNTLEKLTACPNCRKDP